MRKDFFEALFDENEQTCLGGQFSTAVSALPPKMYSEYFCINPLDSKQDHAYLLSDTRSQDRPRRADMNVTSFRNFLFEIDSLSLEDQLKIFGHSGIEFTSIVFSGGKSYHAILALEQPLEANYHCVDSSVVYKKVWKRIAAYIDAKAVELGYGSEGDSFIDSACQNPSRLSRFPNAKRNNGNIQELRHLGSRMCEQDFKALIAKCPEAVETACFKASTVEDPVESALEFWRVAETGLKNKLRYVDWADSSGLYGTLYKTTLWAIDNTGIDKDVFIEVLNQRTFPVLLEAGYPERKLLTAIHHAYKTKRGN